MDFIDLPQLASTGGKIRLPGSKSLSNRALLLAALSEGVTRIHHLLVSDDTARMLEALKCLGVEISESGPTLCVKGCRGQFPVKAAELFLGNAGTAFRSLTAALSFSGGEYVLKGVPRMHERPIGDLVDALRLAGASIDYLEKEGFPPLRLRPAGKKAGACVRVRGDVSSQFLSGLLMALPLTGQETVIEVEGELISKPYVDMTLNLMSRFGIEAARQGWQSFTIPAGAGYRSPGDFYMEGDASSASYFLALGAIGSQPVKVEGVGKNSVQGDIQFAKALEQMGAEIRMGDDWIEAHAPKGGLKGIHLDCNEFPDAAMTLAVTALFAKGETRLTHIGSWRVKETDRLAAMSKELGKLGAGVEEGADFLSITPPKEMQPAMIDTYDDHRMAMCFSLAALGVPVRIHDPGCVAKTFPEYFECFKKQVLPAPVIAIDGPSASGKGTVALRVAEALGFHYLDSGALYRLTVLAAQKRGISLEDETGLAETAASLDVGFQKEGIFLEGQMAGNALRSEAVSAAASKISVFPAVRAALLFRQRTFQRLPGLVCDGRDMASIVFPDARLKVFLTASAQIRAKRRYQQLLLAGQTAEYEQIVNDLKARDIRDAKRAVAPLCQGADALLLDTDNLDIEAATRQVLKWYGQSHQKPEAGKPEAAL